MLRRNLSRSILASLIFTFAIQSTFAQQPARADAPPLVFGKPIERDLKGGEVHSYSLSVQAGQYLNVVVEQKGIDVVVTLFDPKNQKLTEVDSPNGTSGPESFFVLVEATGTHRLDIHSLEKNAPVGRYEARIVELRAATDKDRMKVAAEKIFTRGEQLRMQETETAEALTGAIKNYEEALPLYRQLGDRRREALSLYYIGLIYFYLGDKQKALKYYLDALPLEHANGDKAEEANSLASIASTYSDMGDKQTALKYYNDAVPLLHAVGDRVGEGIALDGIGVLHAKLGEYQEALKLYNDALPLLRESASRDAEANTLNNIGSLYAELGERELALKYFNEALQLFHTFRYETGEARTLNNIGTFYSKLSEYQKALKIYNDALVFERSIGDKSEESKTLDVIGRTYYELRDYQQALKALNEALLLERAIDYKRGEANTLSSIGAVYSATGDKQQALKFYTDALPLRRMVGDKSGEALTLHKLGEGYSANPRFGVFFLKQSVNDYQFLRSNVRSLDKNIQQTFLKSIEAPYRTLADVLLNQGRLNEAQQVLNSFKDQGYFDLNSKKPIAPLTLTERETILAASFDQKLEAVVNAIRRLEAFRRGLHERPLTSAEAGEIAALEKSLQTANDDYRAFLRGAEKQFAAPPDEKDKAPDVADLREMQPALKELSAAKKHQTVAIYTLVGVDNYRALIVTPDNVFTVSTPIKGADLNQKALRLWSLLRTPKYDAQPAANELYKIVFEPFAAHLPKDTKTILWSLDGNLRYIPMAALHDGKKYLVERFENVVFTRADRARMTRPLNPDLAGTGFGSSEAHKVELLGGTYNASKLPAVKVELGRIFKTQNPKGIIAGTVLLDERFTQPAMLAELKVRRPLVHIASHFRFEPGDEARSFLLLGDGSPFTLDEMKQSPDLFSGVDLLTLSACQTAAQRAGANGREVDGFAELAQRLGAGAIMASLWEVSDVSTAELMTSFYRNYRGSAGENKAESLRDAQLALLKGNYSSNVGNDGRLLEQENADDVQVDRADLHLFRINSKARFAHPFYWSPFILIGNWK